MPTRVRVVVSGRVQGVFYRASCAEEARRRGLGGFVRNLPDGRVEATFEGKDADVQAMVDWCRRGPPLAQVTGIDAAPEDPRGDVTFGVG